MIWNVVKTKTSQFVVLFVNEKRKRREDEFHARALGMLNPLHLKFSFPFGVNVDNFFTK